MRMVIGSAFRNKDTPMDGGVGSIRLVSHVGEFVAENGWWTVAEMTLEQAEKIVGGTLGVVDPPFEWQKREIEAARLVLNEISRLRAEAGKLREALRLRERVLSMMTARGWSLHWIHRSAYLHLEAAELAEAVRGKRGDTLDESADVLITMLALSPHGLQEILAAAEAKVGGLMTRPRYRSETVSESTSEHPPAQPALADHAFVEGPKEHGGKCRGKCHYRNRDRLGALVRCDRSPSEHPQPAAQEPER